MRNPQHLAWREELPAEDSAPPDGLPTPKPEDWGVTPEEARDLLRRQICPVCGEGPWKSPLNHAARKHGILKHDLREACGINSIESVVDPELRDRFSERNRELARDMAALASRPRKKYRMTTAGREALAMNLQGVTAEQSRAALERAHTAEARAKRSATLRSRWAAKSDEERAEWGAKVGGGPDRMDKMRRSRRLKPCGTRAAYRRGCRCDDCRAAYLAYRREVG